MIKLSSDMSPEAQKMRMVNKTIDIGKYTVLAIAVAGLVVFIVKKFF